MNNGKIDKYTCEKCDFHIITLHAHTGMNPAIIRFQHFPRKNWNPTDIFLSLDNYDPEKIGTENARIPNSEPVETKPCSGLLKSAHFKTEQSQIPGYQWRSPTPAEFRTLPKPGRKAVTNGSLCLFKIEGGEEAGKWAKVAAPRPAEKTEPSKNRNRRNKRRENAKAFDPPADQMPVSAKEVVRIWTGPEVINDNWIQLSPEVRTYTTLEDLPFLNPDIPPAESGPELRAEMPAGEGIDAPEGGRSEPPDAIDRLNALPYEQRKAMLEGSWQTTIQGQTEKIADARFDAATKGGGDD